MLPIVALVVAQAAGVRYFSTWLVILLGLFMWVLNGGLIAVAFSLFERERLLLSSS